MQKVNSLDNFDAIIMMINHRIFKKFNLLKLIKNPKLKLILDNANFFKGKINIDNKTKFIETGQSNWLN